MHVELIDALQIAAKIRVTYNGKELFTRDFAAGETPVLDFPTPAESGRAEATLIVDDTETPIGSTRYIYKDTMGAQLLTEEAKELSKQGKGWAAQSRIRSAIAILEQIAPDSEELAEAYCSMCWVYFDLKSRPSKKAQRRAECLAWYEKAIAVWERNGNKNKLSGNLTNISAMYSRFGDKQTALARAERGLKMERANEHGDDESIAAWTHAADRNLAVGNLDRAERIAKEGLKRFGEDTANSSHLWVLRARILDARAKDYIAKAEALLPTSSEG